MAVFPRSDKKKSRLSNRIWQSWDSHPSGLFYTWFEECLTQDLFLAERSFVFWGIPTTAVPAAVRASMSTSGWSYIGDNFPRKTTLYKSHCSSNNNNSLSVREPFVPFLASSVLQEDSHIFHCLAMSLSALLCPSLVVLLMLYPTSDHHNMLLVSSVCPQPIYPQLTLPSEFCSQHTITLKENIILKILCCLLW